MRYDKNRVLLMGVIALLVIVLLALVIVALVGLVEKGTTPGANTTAATTISSEPEEDVVIQTPYCDLTFPGQWADFLKVERIEEPNLRLEFIAQMSSGKRQQLFALSFGEPKDPAVGQVVSRDGVAVGIYVTKYDFKPDGTWAVKETTAVEGMLDALDDVLASMDISPLGTPIPELQGDEIVIETPYVKLYLPGKWIEELQISVDETDGYDVVFSGMFNGHDAIALFAVNLGGSKGETVHTLFTENEVAVPVRLRTFELKTDGWATVDELTARTMQEDMNYLLAKLLEQ